MRVKNKNKNLYVLKNIHKVTREAYTYIKNTEHLKFYKNFVLHLKLFLQIN